MSRSSFRKSSLSRAGGVLNTSLDDLGLRHKILERQALAKWGDVVGPQIASATVAENVREGIIFICCKSSMWSNELSLHKTDIVKRLNAAVGKSVISDIRFTARGYRKALEQAREEETGGRAKGLENVRLDESDVEMARQVASVSPSEALSERIQRAILTSKRLKQIKVAEGYKVCPKCGELHNGQHEICNNCR